MYIHNLRDAIQNYEHQREKDGFWAVFAIPLFILSLVIVGMIWLFMPTQASAVWFDSSWDYKVKVEVNPNKVGSSTAITSFPVYVDLAGMPASFWTNTKTAGADVRVVESDEATETAFEIVSFASTTSKGELHFLADNLATTSTSTFYIYYGNPSASAYAVTDPYGRNNVWGSFAAKWHLAESSGNATDATGNGNTASNINTVTYTTSKIYNGANFVRASSQHLDATDSASLTISGTTTTSFWLYLTTLPTSGQVYGLISKDNAAASNREWWLDLYNPSASYQLRYGIHDTGIGSKYSFSYITYAFSSATWYHITVKSIPSNSISTKFQFFVNGVSVGSITANIPITAGRYVYPCVKILKSAGTTNRDYYVDWHVIFLRNFYAAIF